jgi:hypothetical protein
MPREGDSAGYASLIRSLESHQAQPGTISKICQAVAQCLSNNRDNLNFFFIDEKCFLKLLKRIYGFDSDICWLSRITNPGWENDAKALFDLLSPSGVLFDAIRSADMLGRAQFTFPTERLPPHTQEMLMNGRQELERWPQYRYHIMDAGKAYRVCMHGK